MTIKRLWWLSLCLLLILSSSGLAATTVYTDETAFLNDFSVLIPGSYQTIDEGFENNLVWSSTRSPAGATSITSQNIVWTTNHQDTVNPSLVTTGLGPARSGLWGAYALPHGNPDRNEDIPTCDVDVVPPDCLMHDGLTAQGATGQTIYAVGFWYSGTPFGTLGIYLDGVQEHTDILPEDIPRFVGVIDTLGFTSVELRELEGKTGNEKLVFFDDFTLAGDFTPQPNLAISPASANFDSVTVGTSSDLTLTLSNSGSANLNISTIGNVDALLPPFSLVAGQDGCSGQTLAPAASCTITVRYSPTSEGIHNDSFNVPSNDPGSPSVIVDVTGSGAPLPVPNLSPSGLSLQFGNVTVNTTSDKNLTLSNTGSADLTLGEIALSNPLGPNFELLAAQDNCSNQSLAPAANCTLTVRYAPTTVANHSDSFDIPSNDPDTPSVTISVGGSGTAEATPNIALSTTNLVFGSLAIGNTADQTLTVVNSGNADLIVGDIALTNPLVAPYELVTALDTCSNQTLTPASSCSITVRYSPTTAGVHGESFNIPSNDADNANITVNLNGTGTLEPVPNLALSDTTVTFGNVSEGTTSDRSVTLSNTGNADLNVADIALSNPLAAPFELVTALDTCSNQTLTPATSCSITIRYSPSTVGAHNDSFNIPSNDPDTPSASVSVSGTGLPMAANNPPTTPFLVFPADKQTGLETSFAFRWKKSTDVENDPISYDLVYCQDSSFTGCQVIMVFAPETDQNRFLYAGVGGFWVLLLGATAWPRKRSLRLLWISLSIIASLIILPSCGGGGGGGNTPSDEVSYSVSGLQQNTTYYWKVTATDGSDLTESAVRSFTTQ